MRAVSAACLAAALAACGGGSGGGTVTAAGVAPTTPVAPVAPVPPPATYTAIANLFGVQALQTASSGTRFGTSPGQTNALSSHPLAAFGTGITLGFDAAARTFTPSGNGLTETFGPADIDVPNTSALVASYAKRANAGQLTARLNVETPNAGNIAAAYVRTVEWFNIGDLQGPRTYYMVAGVPTIASDMPASGTAAFGNTKVGGVAYVAVASGTTAISGLSLTASAANCALDSATGRVTVQLNLQGRATSTGPLVFIANFVGSGTLVAGTNRFSGSFTQLGGTPALSGTFQGAFFGPQAAECGLAYTMGGMMNGSPAVINGSMAGTRAPNPQLLP